MRPTDLWIKQALALETDECIDWPFAVLKGGYGFISRNGTSITAHSYICSLAHGPRPDGHEAAHSCHNRKCCNKRHLRWATNSENQMDRVEDGTSNRGERHGLSLLTQEQVLAVFNSTETHRVIAAKFGIARQTVGDIRRGRRWGWLTHAS